MTLTGQKTTKMAKNFQQQMRRFQYSRTAASWQSLCPTLCGVEDTRSEGGFQLVAQLDDLCFDISWQQRNIASAMLGGFLKQLYLDAVSFVFLPCGFSCDIYCSLCALLYIQQIQVSQMKNQWFENVMNRGTAKSCKCWHWWFKELG